MAPETKPPALPVPYLPWLVLATIALLTTFTVAKLITTAQTFSQSNGEKEKITISAEGKISASPDIAIFSVGVTAEGKDAKALQNDAATKMNAIITKLQQLGVDKKDLKTQELNLQPKYDWSKGTSAINGYTVNQQLEVKVRDITKAGTIYAEAVDLGSNAIGNIRYEFADVDNLKQEARKEALTKAKTKSEDLAKTAGVKLGKLLNFTENSVSEPRMYATGISAMDTKEAAVAPSVESGTQDITAQISVTYELL